jgi:hypothetical protein
MMVEIKSRKVTGDGGSPSEFIGQGRRDVNAHTPA